MTTSNSKELAEFNRFVTNLLMGDQRELLPEEALDLWRSEHPLPEELADSVAAIREALADMEAGDQGIPFEDFAREFRKQKSAGKRE